MKSNTNLISAIAIAIVIIGVIAFILWQGDTPGSDRGGQAGNQARSTSDRDLTAQSKAPRVPRTPRFQSVEDAEQALQDFDLTAIKGSDQEEAKRCFDRLIALAANIPEVYYSELAASIGQGAENDLDRLFKQMAIYQEWGRKNLESAVADLANVEGERLFYKALHRVLVGAMDTNAAAAMNLAETIDIEPGGLSDRERIDLMDTIYDSWVESDSFSALEWARQASVPDKRRDQWIADGLRAWSKKEPDAAERWRVKENFEGFDPNDY